jgi:Ribbon-helix-helix protein, copG family
MRVSTTPKKQPPKITVAMTEEMLKGLEEERKVRRIATVPEVVRIIVSEYFKGKDTSGR